MTRRWTALMILSLFAATLLLRCDKKNDTDTDTDADYDTSSQSSNDSEAKDSESGSGDDSVIPELTWQTDPTGDLFDSISANDPTHVSDLIDIIGFGGRSWSCSADTAAEFNSLYSCDSTENAYVICMQGAGELTAGNYYVVGTQLAAFVPLSSGEYSYIHSMVWDSDGESANNWVPQGQYDWDLYQGADLWYELIWDHQGGQYKGPQWSFSVSQVSDQQLPMTTTSKARALIMDDKIIYFVPAAELPGVDPRYRVGSFAHPGNWDPQDRGLDCSGANPTEPLTKPE